MLPEMPLDTRHVERVSIELNRQDLALLRTFCISLLENPPAPRISSTKVRGLHLDRQANYSTLTKYDLPLRNVLLHMIESGYEHCFGVSGLATRGFSSQALKAFVSFSTISSIAKSPETATIIFPEMDNLLMNCLEVCSRRTCLDT